MQLTNRPELVRGLDPASNFLTLCSGKEACSDLFEPVPPPPASGIHRRELCCDTPVREPLFETEEAQRSPAERPLSKEHLQQGIAAHRPLVERIVRQLAQRLPANVQRDDLVSAGLFGLVDALRRNGGDQGEGFQWYARMRIRGAIFDELRSQDWLSRRARDRVSGKHDESGAATATMVSLEEVIATEEAAHFATDEEDPLEVAESRSQQRVLAEAVEHLPERERQIVGRHYFEGVKLKDIGAELGVSEPRVSQLHARALGRLRALLMKRPAGAVIAPAETAPVARSVAAPAARTSRASVPRPKVASAARLPVASAARRALLPRSARQSLPSSSALPLMGASSA